MALPDSMSAMGTMSGRGLKVSDSSSSMVPRTLTFQSSSMESQFWK